MPRFAKQFLYGTFYLAILSGILFGAYQKFLKPAPSCFDTIQNQDEEGIDCGSVCGNFCLPADVQPVESVGSVSIFHPIPDRIAVLAQIRNPNSIAATVIPYHIAFFDEKDAPLRVITGETYLAAQETRFIADFPEGADLASAVRATIAFDEPQWVRSADLPRLPVSISQYHPQSDGKQLIVEGIVSNDATISASSVTVLVFFYGTLGQMGGVSKAELSGIGPHETRVFTVQYPLFPGADPSRAQVVVNARR